MGRLPWGGCPVLRFFPLTGSDFDHLWFQINRLLKIG